jgi:hypothetical protein
LREHLAEVHAYATQTRDDLEKTRLQLQEDAERVRQQEVALQGARDEHRLAVAAFRQQLIEWQAKVGEMRHALHQGETQLDRRKAEVGKQEERLASASARLADQEARLEREQRVVAERRGEVDRHLNDMRDWYRRKMRELAGVDEPGAEEPDQTPSRAILTMTDAPDAADRHLSERLRDLGLIDDDTCAALLGEAQRKRRSLRQLLLAGGYLTLYQMALIEAGNLDGLVLGPVRVIDRLRATPREACYRVFDPRRETDALLRHLSEAEMLDAVNPDEFRQRFAAAMAVRHPHVAQVEEVLDIAGRPAVLCEWVSGLPSSEWPALAAAGGAWYRLVNQAALSLQTIHAAGLCHGRLEAGSFLLTEAGLLKLCGLGEPRWLAGSPSLEQEESVQGDLLALGRLAAGWAALGDGANGAKLKPLPSSLQAVLGRLQTEGGYADAAALLADLDQAGARLPGATAAWERLLRQVREQAPAAVLRRSA